jgi:simple sugar transport system permease protein
MDNVLRLALVFSLALLFGALVIALSGRNPFEVYHLLFVQSFGSRQALADTLLNSTPLIFTGLATLVAFRTGIFNVGVEGSLYLGAFAAAWVGFTFTTLPGWLLTSLCLSAAAFAGALWLLPPAYLRARFHVDEVVSTLLLNYVAINLTSYLVNYPFLAPGTANSMTVPIADQARLGRLVDGSQLNSGFLFALAAALLVTLLYRHTVLGYMLRVVGSNPLFAQAVGIPVARIVVLSMLLSGLIGGLCGAVQTLGVTYRFVQGFSPGFGFEGIAVALIAGNNPFLVVLAAVLLGAMRTGGTNVQLFMDIPLDLIDVLQAVIVLLVTVQITWRWLGGRSWIS